MSSTSWNPNASRDRRAHSQEVPRLGGRRSYDFDEAPDFDEAISAIFQDLLSLDAPDPDADLVATGLLDSLLIVGLITALEARYRVRIQLHQVDLEKVRTTRGLEQLIIEAYSGQVDRNSVVSLLRAGSGRPVFLVHNAWGTVGKELPAVLETGRPIYALQAAYRRPEVEPPAELEHLAASYVREVRKVQPDGPYTLAGFSFGGLVAYEMAVQLDAIGETVDLLGMVDAQAHTAVLSLGDRFKFKGGLALRRARRILAPARFSRNLKKARSRLERSSDAREHPLARLGLPEDIRRSMDISWALMAEYRPEPYPGDAILLVPEVRSPYESDPQKVWPRKVKGGLRTVTIPGNHRRLEQASWDAVGATLSPLLVESSHPV